MAAGPAVDPLVQLGAALHHGRLARGLSLRVLARRLGLGGHSVLVDYERGRRVPPDYVIAGYERVFEDQDGALRGLRDAVFRARAERSTSARLRESAPEPGESEPGGEPSCGKLGDGGTEDGEPGDGEPDGREPSGDGLGGGAPGGDSPGGGEPGGGGPAQIAVTPAQLPAGLPDFVGRAEELARLRTVADRPGPAPTVIAVSGLPGVGKTSLAVHFAREVAGRHPDCQLYVDLRGADREPLDPAEALAGFLAALGIPAGGLPAGLDRRAALFRSAVHGKRPLLVLDNAAGEDQVRPLLPGDPGALVLVTSRGPLAGLECAHHLALDVLDRGSAVELVSRVAGADRVAAEPEAAERVVRYCGHLPLATRIAASRLSTWPRWKLVDCATELADEQTRLDWLEAGDRHVYRAFRISYDALPDDARALLRGLALVPGPDFGPDLAGLLLDADRAAGRRALARLARLGLVQPAAGPERYRFHDLVALFARERLASEDGPVARADRELAVLRWLLKTAADGGSVLDPTGYCTPSPDTPLRTRADALRWLDLERTCVLGAIRRATALGRTELVFPLVPALPWYFDLRCHRTDWRELAECALRLADQVGCETQRLRALNALGLVLRELGSVPVAIGHCRQALAVARRLGDREEEGVALDRLALALILDGAATEAIEHLNRAVEINRDLGWRRDEGGCFNHLGEAHLALGEWERARTEFTRAVAIFDELAEERGGGMAYAGLGQALAGLGRYGESLERHRQALARFERSDDRWGRGLALRGMGVAALAGADVPRARMYLETSAELFQQHDERQLAETMRVLADLADRDRR